MRRLRFLLIGLALIVMSCVKDEARDGQDGSTPAELTVSLSADARTGAMATRTDGEEVVAATVPAELVPSVDDFEVEVYNAASKVRLYRDTYVNSVGKIIRLNTGEFRLLAQHGDSLGCGFGKPYFVADHNFELTPENPKQAVNATAVLGNVMSDVAFSENVPGSYYDYYVILRHQDHSKKSLKFVRDENRPGFIPGGNIVIEFYADLTGNGDWKYAKTESRVYSPGDYVHVNIDVEPRKSNLLFNLTVNDAEETVEVPLDLPAWVTPQDAPSISLAGFDENNKCRVIEGVDVGMGGSVSILARAAISSCVLNVQSGLLEKAGFPVNQDIDIANADADMVKALNDAGIEWNDDLLGCRDLSYINLAGLVEYLNTKSKASKQEKTLATFTLKVTDEVMKETATSFSVVSVPINPAISIKDYNIWATKLVAPTVTVSEGANRDLFKVQIREQGNPVWSDLADKKLHGTGLSLRCDDIDKLKPGTTYQLRVIYNNNLEVASDAFIVATEAAQQIGNSGFEEFSTESFQFTTKSGWTANAESRDWFLPWNSGATANEKWWAVNSRATMPSVTEPDNLDFKVFPTVAFSVESAYEGSKSALIASVQTSDDATSSSDGDTNIRKSVGEIFIGTSSDDGGHASDGKAFKSRPTAFSFYYRYYPVNNETFYVRLELYDSDNNMIAAQEETSLGAPEVDKWTKHVMEIDYLNVMAKAAKIYVSFKSSSLKDTEAGYRSGSNARIEMGGIEYTARIGSVLKVDDLELLYY